jgi:hypothetical protein
MNYADALVMYAGGFVSGVATLIVVAMLWGGGERGE